MSKIRQALRLLADSGLSMRQVAAALGVSKSTVSEIAMYARDAGGGLAAGQHLER
jgi:DNA-directed RNA polymerase specialized sigma24 family protein